MWTAQRAPSRPQRTPSVHSIASVHSQSRPTSMVSSQLQRRSGGYESDQSSDTLTEDEAITSFPQVPSNNNLPPMWQSGRQQSGTAVSRLSQKFANANATVAEIQPPPLRTQHRHQQESMENSPDDDTNSRSSTLGGSEDFEYPEKTPTSVPRKVKIDMTNSEASHIPGPLEMQLASLMSKLIHIEQANPVAAVTPEDFAEMSKELKALREEKKTWTKRHEAIWALRDEDVENNIKIRGMLAKARRELEGMTKLRDEDLVNVQVVRIKLAEATRQLERERSQNGRSSPSRGRPGSMMMERRGTMDLFAAAKAAALEQRAMELEKRNQDLLAQIETLKGGANIDDLNRMTAHQAWKDTVSGLESKVKSKDAEIARLRSGDMSGSSSAPSGTGVDFARIEALHEEHSNYREKVGGKMQALRSEKEQLEKENHALEVKILSLQRRVSLM